MPSGPPTLKEIVKIAHRTTDIIKYNVTPNVCLFGSAASHLWADIGRVPNDIDIVVSDKDWDPELIKQKIIEADSRYYLERSRKRGARYQILYCRLPGWATDKTRRVKVDILVPPTLNLPMFMAFEVPLLNNIPVMPLFDLLVMKMQGWKDHLESNRTDQRAKRRNDVSDIFALLEPAEQENVSYVDEAKEYRHSPEFMNHARILVNIFVSHYGRVRQWRALRFPVSKSSELTWLLRVAAARS